MEESSDFMHMHYFPPFIEQYVNRHSTKSLSVMSLCCKKEDVVPDKTWCSPAVPEKNAKLDQPAL